MIKEIFTTAVAFVLGSIFCLSMAAAQDRTMSDVHLFQGFFRDTPISEKPYVEPGIRYDDYEHGTRLSFDAQGGYALHPKFELGARFGLVSVDPDNGDDETELSDLWVSGRYDMSTFLPLSADGAKASVGGYFTLPTGDEDVGEDNTDFGIFSALRYPFENALVLTAVLGIDFIELYDRHGDKDRETSLLLGGGAIYPLNNLFSIVGEFNLWTEGDYIFLTGGVDYNLQTNGRLRGFLGFGLDDGAPDFSLSIRYLISF